MKQWQKILAYTSALLIVVYAVVVCTMPRVRHEGTVCQKIDVVITDSTQRQYVRPGEILHYLKEAGLSPVGQPYELIACHTIEEYAARHPMIDQAECYKTTDGNVKLLLTQRQPVLRVANEGNYFVDNHRQIMPLRSTTATYVPVVTGRVSKRMACEELFDFVLWLQDSKFWDAQIEQINVNEQLEIELVPRVGSGTILLGRLDNDYPKRLNKLKKLYTEGFQTIGWKSYREIDLRYKDQIVCR